MKATITVEDELGRVFAQSVIEDAQMEHLFAEFRAAVSDFRSVSQAPCWSVHVEVEDA
jgi:hypothetical protein